MVLIMGGQNELEKCTTVQPVSKKDMEKPNSMPLSPQVDANSSSEGVEASCLYQGIEHGLREDAGKPNSTPLSSQVDANSSSKGVKASCVHRGIEHGVCYSSTPGHGYMYIGHDRICPQWDDQRYFVPQAPHSSPGTQPAVTAKGYHQLSKISSSSNLGQGGPFPNNTSPRSRLFYSTPKSNHFPVREKFSMQRNYGFSRDLVRGPRANRKTNSNLSVERDNLSPSVQRHHYNKPDFQVKYEQAKFFMIKSYSEDDIHRSIKYNVWSSTPNGNSKLDAAFRKAEMEKMEKGLQCPIFLFFSVNASGQFVGLAEMIGPVDFKKNMDFWQQDKWNGFFPVKWHIIKDIPNRNFQHITLENNDNKAVTFSRDTQEIKLPQGLSMLQMFKAYQLGTSILDDFDFYEERETSLLGTRSSRPVMQRSDVDIVDENSMRHLESSFGNMSMSGRASRPHAASKYTSSNYAWTPSVSSSRTSRS